MESVYAHYALQELHILPSVFLNMGREEKAFVIASIKQRSEDNEKETNKIKNPKRGKRRKG